MKYALLSSFSDIVDLASERTVLLEHDVRRLVGHHKEPGICPVLLIGFEALSPGRIDAHIDDGRRLASIYTGTSPSWRTGHVEGDAIDLPCPDKACDVLVEIRLDAGRRWPWPELIDQPVPVAHPVAEAKSPLSRISR